MEHLNQKFKLHLKLYNDKEKISLSKRFFRFLADMACHWISITGSFSNLYYSVFGGGGVSLPLVFLH